MCGRFTLRTTGYHVAQAMGVAGPQPATWQARYNVAPTQTVLAVRPDNGGREAVGLRWGLVPPWAKDPAIGSRMINARAETVGERPAYRRAIRDRRCLVPADGFYEWPKSLARGREKWPVLIALPDDELFAFGGIWERWRDPSSGESIDTMAILTTEPTPSIAHLHDRMPLILPRQAYADWLDLNVHEVEALRPLMRPYTGEFVVSRVGRAVNKAGVEDPELVAPLAEGGSVGNGRGMYS